MQLWFYFQKPTITQKVIFDPSSLFCLLATQIHFYKVELEQKEALILQFKHSFSNTLCVFKENVKKDESRKYTQSLKRKSSTISRISSKRKSIREKLKRKKSDCDIKEDFKNVKISKTFAKKAKIDLDEANKKHCRNKQTQKTIK